MIYCTSRGERGKEKGGGSQKSGGRSKNGRGEGKLTANRRKSRRGFEQEGNEGNEGGERSRGEVNRKRAQRTQRGMRRGAEGVG